MKYCIYFPLALFFLLSHVCAAQNTEGSVEDRMLTPAMWGKGSILLNDGSELKGLVRYDDRNSVLAFQNGDDSRSFTPRSVTAFEYFDESANHQRIYYVFPYEDPINEAVRPQFFELLREFKKFTVLAKTDPLSFEQKNYNYASKPHGSIYAPTTLEIRQTEIIYLMDLNNTIKPYIRTTSKQDGAKSLFTGKDLKTKEKMLDGSLLADMVTKPVYQKLEQYAKEKDLSFKYKDELLKILDYYKTLENQP